MTRPISSYPEHQRLAAIQRRAKEQRGGLGYWAAIDAQRRLAWLLAQAKREAATEAA